MEKIKFLEEKKWIMALFMKRRKKFSQTEVFRTWTGWWKDDFVDDGKKLIIYNHHVYYPFRNRDKNAGNIKIHEELDTFFQDTYNWIIDTVRHNSIEKIKKERFKRADNRSTPQSIERLAKEKGYMVRKSSTSNHPMRVSGYCITHLGNSKKIVCGEKFDMTLEEIRKFLQESETNRK